MAAWQLQQAKARLSELVKRARKEGPQEIRVHGQPAAVLVSHDEYLKLTTPAQRFVEFVRQSPLRGARLEITRDKTLPRDFEL